MDRLLYGHRHRHGYRHGGSEPDLYDDDGGVDRQSDDDGSVEFRGHAFGHSQLWG